MPDARIESIGYAMPADMIKAEIIKHKIDSLLNILPFWITLDGFPRQYFRSIGTMRITTNMHSRFGRLPISSDNLPRDKYITVDASCIAATQVNSKAAYGRKFSVLNDFKSWFSLVLKDCFPIERSLI